MEGPKVQSEIRQSIMTAMEDKVETITPALIANRVMGKHGQSFAYAVALEYIRREAALVIGRFDTSPYPSVGKVGPVAMKQRIATAIHQIKQARRDYGSDKKARLEYLDAGLILEWMKRENIDRVERSEIMQNRPSSFRKTDRIEPATGVLIDCCIVKLERDFDGFIWVVLNPEYLKVAPKHWPRSQHPLSELSDDPPPPYGLTRLPGLPGQHRVEKAQGQHWESKRVGGGPFAPTRTQAT